MPEMAEPMGKLEDILKDKQGHLSRIHCEHIIKALDSGNNIKTQVIENLLELCIQDPKDDMKYAVDMLNIVSAVLKNAMAEKITPKPNLLPSMLKILHMIKITLYSSKSADIKILYFQALLSYPDEVYAQLETHYVEVLELLNLYLHQRIPIDIRIQTINILHEYLKVLPPDKRATFVKEGIDTWLLKLIPNVMVFVTTPNTKLETSIETLELVANELLHTDYFDNPNWDVILQCVCTPQKYPAMMTTLLEKGSDIWHRLWTVFIKILKNQITKSTNNLGSPINSMLAVVETAFKMDITNRCRAFYCWNVLIDNFSSETNEVYINKRLKLLLIPLCANNAKVEEIAIAKLKTWWHLICCFHKRMKKFSEVILSPFMEFCFGKQNVGNKPLFVPGLISETTKEHCMEAFVNILGHHNCGCSVTLPKLDGKLLTGAHLVDKWKDWMFYIKSAIKHAANNNKLRQPLKCVWISFVKIICDLPDNDVRRNLFKELLSMLEDLIQGSNVESIRAIVLNDLILPLFEEDIEINRLLKTCEVHNSPVHKIVTIMLNPSLASSYNRNNMSEAVEKLKPFANFITHHYFNTIEAFLKELPINYTSLIIWTALTASICEKKNDTSAQILHKLILWPLQHMDLFSNVEYSTSLWHDMYEFCRTKISTSCIEDEILDILKNYKNIKVTNSSFLLKVSITLLKHKVTSDNGTDYGKELDLVQYITSKIRNLNKIYVEFATLLEITSIILKNLSNSVNVNTAKQVLSIMKIVFSLLRSEFKDNKQVQPELLLKIEDFLKSIEFFFNVEAYVSLKEMISTELIDCTPYLGQHQSLKTAVASTLRILLKDMDNPSVNDIKKSIESLEQDTHVKNTTESKFTTPDTVIANKAKKKATSIVNTVVENGEEFVVVKSNWKFNPKKLTDNQKEKFRRKREDIPALYQDLSQSQDDFKLNAWKTDSQDTTTSSKSNDVTTNNVVSSILKNMPNTDFMPKILQDILTVNNKDNSSPESKNENIKKIQSPINKEVKTPRLALKDRVFRNVRNLIEKSSIQNDDKDEKASINDVMKTPVGMKIKTTNIITNSAPTEINLERPTRVKRKPKKFDDLQVFSLKKRRHSLGNCSSRNSDSDPEQIQDITNSEQDKDIESSAISVSDNQENPIKPPLEQHKETVIEEIAICDVTKGVNDESTVNAEKIVDVVKSDDVTENIDSQSNTNMKQAIVVIDDISVKLDSKLKNNEPTEVKEDNTKQTPANKKTDRKKSRIEKQLTIDMVEGHPLLKGETPKRLTRKKALESPTVSKRRSLVEKLNKSKTDQKNTPKVDKQLKETNEPVNNKTERSMDTFPNSQDLSTSLDISGSQDIIESSQDSTVSIMSTKSPRNIKRIPVIALENIEIKGLYDKTNRETKSLDAPQDETVNNLVVSDSDIKDCSGFPLNKTATEHAQVDLTENMDTEPMGNVTTDEIIEISDDPPIIIDNNDTFMEMDTQNIADADTQLVDPNVVAIMSKINKTPAKETVSLNTETNKAQAIETTSTKINDSDIPTQDDITKSLTESLLLTTEQVSEQIGEQESSSTLSFKEDEQRKQDFLNNTIEISPIKTLSPVRGDKSPTPETSNDYVVIKLSSPVQSNGEPCEKCDSPEIFTEDKVSPDKRDQSPPREQSHTTNASPRSLSLKRNKPQVRAGGRAAQMLGLCVPVTDRLQTIKNTEKTVENEEPKKCSPLNTSAKRNLRILYNSTNEGSGTSEETEEIENFLKLKRNLPSADSSPSVPILKRKLDIVDDATASPASKRKRVSFHDPPVSTTICVKKYIEPCGIRSPQNSAVKRQERQLRAQVCVNLKSQKRLDTVFKLDTALVKAVESFSDGEVTPNTDGDTQISSMEETPLVEVVKNSELNDVDPICLDLIDCKDPIDNIASDLSSPAMKPLLVKEFAGKIETVGDLAKLTELEVNRLCIKAPKVQITKKVLTEYAKKLKDAVNEITPSLEVALSESGVVEPKSVDVEMKIVPVVSHSIEVQTETLATSLGSTQTDIVPTKHCIVQTDESGDKSTADIVTSLMEKRNFCERLKEQLDLPSKRSIAETVPPRDLMNIVVNQMSLNKAETSLIDRILEHHSLDSLNDKLRLSCISDYLSQQFSSKDLILFCSDLLKKVHDKTV
ncbi:uncharacterized protein Rif1 isoform X2 [Epargyreus clarus]